MKLKTLLIAVTAMLATLSHAEAFEPLSWLSGHAKCWPDCVGKFCCDDYCGKPLPCAVAVKCFECPDYCAKPLPCPPFGKTGYCCDDFCPKPLPPICCVSGKNLRCIPNRLPPVDSHIPKKPSAPTNGIVNEDVEDVEVVPVSSSGRVYIERNLGTN